MKLKIDIFFILQVIGVIFLLAIMFFSGTSKKDDVKYSSSVSYDKETLEDMQADTDGAYRATGNPLIDGQVSPF